MGSFGDVEVGVMKGEFGDLLVWGGIWFCVVVVFLIFIFLDD